MSGHGCRKQKSRVNTCSCMRTEWNDHQRASTHWVWIHTLHLYWFYSSWSWLQAVDSATAGGKKLYKASCGFRGSSRSLINCLECRLPLKEAWQWTKIWGCWVRRKWCNQTSVARSSSPFEGISSGQHKYSEFCQLFLLSLCQMASSVSALDISIFFSHQIVFQSSLAKTFYFFVILVKRFLCVVLFSQWKHRTFRRWGRLVTAEAFFEIFFSRQFIFITNANSF